MFVWLLRESNLVCVRVPYVDPEELQPYNHNEDIGLNKLQPCLPLKSSIDFFQVIKCLSQLTEVEKLPS